MLRHHLLIIYRNFKRNKSSFFINLIGLSSGLACALLIYLWVNDELSVDKFHENDDRLYHVMLNDPDGNTITTSPYTPHHLAKTLVEEVAEVKEAVAVIPSKLCTDFLGEFTVSIETKKLKTSGQFAEKDFFKVFSYPLVEGSTSEVLANPGSIAISEGLAEKLFDSSKEAVGKVVYWQLASFSGQATVTGIFRNIPAQSTSQFDFVLDFHMWYEVARQMGIDTENWGNQAPFTYLVVHEGADKLLFEQKMKEFSKSRSKISQMELLAIPYSSQYLYGNFKGGQQVGSRIKYVQLFTVIAVLILLVACINFMNLSTARASGRMKEVGIKKTLGLNRKGLVFQFISESIVMTFLSSMVAILLVLVILPGFNEITGKQLSVDFNDSIVLSILVITGLTGLVSGSYPAFYLSGFNPVSVLKGRLQTSLGELWVRKGLVIFQFIVTIVLISAVFVIYEQIRFIQTKNLGYDRENVIYFPKEGNVAEKPEIFLSEMNKIPGVISSSSMSGNLSGMFSSTGDFSWEGKDPDLNMDFGQLSSSYDLIETLKIELLEGRNFSRQFTEGRNLIFNEAAISVMGLNDPVGKKVKLWGNDHTIIGVVKDFHFESLHENVKPMAIMLEPDDTFRMLVRLDSDGQAETLAQIEDLYKKFNPGFSFDFKFLNKEYQVLYESEKRVSTLSKLFAGLAVLISCLGLFGMVVFTTERRIKEIGIRKVLGSNELGIVKLLSRDFTKMVIIAIFIALPLGYLIADQWLQTFSYHIDLAWWYFAEAGLITLMIAWFTVGMQTVKAALMNPVDTLRTE